MDNATVIERLREALPDMIQKTSEFRGMVSVYVEADAIVDVAAFLRDDPDLSYNFLENLCGVDYLGRNPRFEVVYHLLSLKNRHHVCVKVGLPEQNPAVPTLTDLWPTANWQETRDLRLIWDHLHRPPWPPAHPDARGLGRLSAAQGCAAGRRRGRVHIQSGRNLRAQAIRQGMTNDQRPTTNDSVRRRNDQ